MERERAASEISPGLWISGMPGADWDLAGWGFEVIVSLSEHLPPQAARRIEWGSRGGAIGEGAVVFVHWPFADGEVPSMELAEMVAEWVVGAVGAGRQVLIHCQEGRNRTGLVGGLALMRLKGLDGAGALAHLREARTGMVYNARFEQALCSYGRGGVRAGASAREGGA